MSAKVIKKEPNSLIYFFSCLIGVTTLIFLFFSSLRFFLFGAGLDLGFFDQLLYLLTQGYPPISSLIEGVHLIGDHAAFILYPISLFYFIHPNVHWLLLIQAFALAAGSIPIYLLSVQNGLSSSYGKAIAICYVLYPALFNINFYTEFRPETIAVPAFLWAVWAAKARYKAQFAIAIILAFSCKDIISLTVVALGFWLYFFEKRRIYGLTCMGTGVAWFLICAYYIIPTFRGGNPMAGTWNYASFGNSVSELAFNVITNPVLVIQTAFLPDRLFYYLLLILPILIGLHLRQIAAIIPALPMLFLNILSEYSSQRDLIHHYSLPIIPFIFVWLIYSISDLKNHKKRLWLSQRWLVTWAIIAFLALAKYSYFYTHYFPLLPTNSNVRSAIHLIEPQGSILTTAFISPHLSHRPMVKILQGGWDLEKIKSHDFDYVLFSLKHLSIDHETPLELVNQMIEQLKSSPDFSLIYQENDVFLFQNQHLN